MVERKDGNLYEQETGTRLNGYLHLYLYLHERKTWKKILESNDARGYPPSWYLYQRSFGLPSISSFEAYRRYLVTFPFNLPKARTVVPYTFSALHHIPFHPRVQFTSLAISVRQLTSPFLPSLFSNRQNRNKRKGPKSKPESGLTTPSDSTNAESRLSIWGWTCRRWDGSSYQQQV